MYSHCPSQTHKVYPFCPNISEEVPVNENKSLCDYYCDLITEYLSDKEKALQCAKEVMRDDIYIKMLSMLNNLTQKVRLHIMSFRKFVLFFWCLKQCKKLSTKKKKCTIISKIILKK